MQGAAIMKRLQQWFDLIAGISHDQQARLEQARAIFAASGPDVAELQMPACWRRRARICAA
jgi:hypothetical protein